MAMNRWMKNTREGLKTNWVCRYLIIQLMASLFLFAFVGFGYFVLWLATPHILMAIAPFSRKAVETLAHLGLRAMQVENLRAKGGFPLWVFVGGQLLVGVFGVIGGVFLISKGNFSLISLLFVSAGH